MGLFEMHLMQDNKAHSKFNEFRSNNMTRTQHDMYQEKTKEMEKMANELEQSLNSMQWVERFTDMGFYRGWRKLDNKLSKIMNIAKVDSPAVAIIVEQKHTKLSLAKIEVIATIVTEEKDREKIKRHLLTKSWKEAKKDVDLIIATYNPKAA